ncbi:MAG: hypothetical protein M1831_003825 [Alyxoria varia]|nr:MAG: hypothetical protein M1831_003825 [Alyxoria varia]
MPTKKSSNKQRSDSDNISGSDDNNNVTINNDVTRLLERVLDGTRTRNDKKRDGFEKEAEALASKANKQLAELDKEYSQKIMSLRREHIARLRGLVKEKQELEGDLRSRLVHLSSSCDGVNNDMSIILHHKIAQMDECPGDQKQGAQQTGQAK